MYKADLVLDVTMFRSRKATEGIRQSMPLPEFVRKLKMPKLGEENYQEYMALDKAAQDELKDVGGYICGISKDNTRKKDSIESITGIVFDIDDGTVGLLDKIEALADFYYLVHSTRKHTAANPRYRVVVPLAASIPVEHREPIARKLAEKMGILNEVDVSCFRFTQMQYFPSVCKDAEFIFSEGANENLLEPKAVLDEYKNWDNMLEWPLAAAEAHKREKALNAKAGKLKDADRVYEDPAGKPGYVGAFCRVYNIPKAIDKYLSEVYEPGDSEGRYTLKSASSSNGLVLLDEQWAVSYHASDPVNQGCDSLRAINGYDLVRIHLFGDLDDGVDKHTTVMNLPSTQAMNAFIDKDELVKAELLFDLDIGLEPHTSSFPGETAEGLHAAGVVDKRALLGLKLTSSGKTATCPENFELIMDNDKYFENIAYNTLARRIDCRKPSSWRLSTQTGLTDAEIARLKIYISSRYGIYNEGMFDNALKVVAMKRKFNPVKDYLDNAGPWDGIPRLEKLFIDYLGAEDNVYVRAVTRATLCGAVARIYEPGVKMDTMLILCGGQGIGKSQIFKALAGEYFTDSITLKDMEDGKKASEKLQGKWIAECAELAGMSKADQLALKSFLTSTSDNYRAAFARCAEDNPRMSIFVGTSNEEEGFLRDPTGGRRYLCVKVKGGSKEMNPFTLTKEIVEQVWAEAKVLYEKGEKLFLEGETLAMAHEIQRTAMVSDERQGIVEKYLDTDLPSNWNKMDLLERRSYLEKPVPGLDNNAELPLSKRTVVCPMEIACEALGYDKGKVDNSVSQAINLMLAKIPGWKKGARRNRDFYGNQRVSVRVVE